MKEYIIQLAKPIISHSPRLAMTYRYARDTWNLYKEPQKKTPTGFKLVGNPLMQRAEYEPDETRIVQNILQHTDVFINIGANIGYYCCIALHFEKSSRSLHLNPTTTIYYTFCRTSKQTAGNLTLKYSPLP